MTSLLILREIFKVVKKEKGASVEPWQIFDLIGGTSTGGLVELILEIKSLSERVSRLIHRICRLIAIMLGRLRMSIEETITAYKELSPIIFKKKWWTQNNVLKVSGSEMRHYWFEGKNLVEAVTDLLGKREMDPNTLLKESEDSSCRVYVLRLH